MHADDDSSDPALHRALEGLASEIGADGIDHLIDGLQPALRQQHLGDFVLGRELGRGGMGVVFAAEQLSVPGRRVAVKLLQGLGGSNTAKRRFAREVEAIGRLDHPHIVPILSAHADGPTPWFAMKYVEGRTLRGLLADGSLRGDFRRIATMVRDLAGALHHAHQHGIVHRDVKPGNVMVDGDARAMLLDFGLASLVEDDSELTMSTDAVGTPGYMSPEQVRPALGKASPRTDVYALGVTLYECLSGRQPFAAETRHETMNRILRGGATRLHTIDRTIPRDLETICEKAMQRAAADRYPTAAALAADLDTFLQFRAIAARPQSALRRLQELLRRHRLFVASLALATGAFVAAGLWWGLLEPVRQVAGLLREADAVQRQLGPVRQQLDASSTVRSPDDALRRRADALRIERNRLERELEYLFEAGLSIRPGNGEVLARYADLLAIRLRRALQGGGMLLRQPEVLDLEPRLRRIDVVGRHRDLLDRTSDLHVRCDAGPARVVLCPETRTADGCSLFVTTDDPRALELGTTPTRTTAPAGSYLLVAHREGFVDIQLPLLLRRRAQQTERERQVDLAFLTAAEVGPRYRQIHAGFGVVYDERTAREHRDRVEFHEGFLMTEREVRLEDIDTWLDHVRSEPVRPLQRSTIENLSWDTLTRVVGRLQQLDRASDSATYTTLPSPREWQRAGRGADGREYPWGWQHDWSFSQNYRSATTEDEELIPTTFPAQDVSPFGIRELIGSAREVCVPLSTLQRVGTKQFQVCGGSHHSIRESDLTLSTQRTLLHNQVVPDAGLRLVRRPLPPPPTGPATLRLADAPAASWQLVAPRPPFFEVLPPGSRVADVDGRLELRGFAGNYSAELLAWQGIDGDTADFELHAELQHRHDAGLGDDRGVKLVLGQRPGLRYWDQPLSLHVSRTSWHLSFGHEDHKITAPLATDDDDVLEVVVRGHAHRWEAILRGHAGGPSILSLERPADAPKKWHYVGVRLPQFCRATASIRRFEYGR